MKKQLIEDNYCLVTDRKKPSISKSLNNIVSMMGTAKMANN